LKSYFAVWESRNEGAFRRLHRWPLLSAGFFSPTDRRMRFARCQRYFARSVEAFPRAFEKIGTLVCNVTCAGRSCVGSFVAILHASGIFSRNIVARKSKSCAMRIWGLKCALVIRGNSGTIFRMDFCEDFLFFRQRFFDRTLINRYE